MTAPVRVLGSREVARRIERELCRRWPSVRFAVRPGGRDEARTVAAAWSDGPTEAAVAELARPFEAIGSGDDARGPIRYGIHRVLTARTITPAGYEILADALERRYPITIARTATGIDWHAAHGVTVAAPILLHGSTFGPLHGTDTGPVDEGPVTAAHALHLLAEAADLSEFDTEPGNPRRALLHGITARARRASTHR
ncbi:LPD29 domain-containing protein [Nocardia sp. NPDC004582]